MERIPCQFANTDACDLYRQTGRCFEDDHHLFYPRAEYKTKTERNFRLLGANIIRICRNLHNIEHAIFPKPEKPDEDVMLAAIQDQKDKRKK